MKLVLASGSPRRAEILRNAGISFDVLAADVDETLRPGEMPRDYVRRLAEEKARAAAQKLVDAAPGAGAIVIGADTTVVVADAILGKPESPAEARDMLERLSGRTHEVYTGIALLQLPSGPMRTFEEITRVEFAPMDAAEIAQYIASGEPFGKAGGYAIQGLGGKFVKRIEGCYFNVMGLPLARLYAELCTFGWYTTPKS